MLLVSINVFFFPGRIQGCFDALEKQYVSGFFTFFSGVSYFFIK